MKALLFVIIAVLGVAVVWLFMSKRTATPARPGTTLDAWGNPATAPPKPASKDGQLASDIGAAVAAAFTLANSLFASGQK